MAKGFGDAVKAFAAKTKTKAAKEARRITLGILANVVTATPVDTGQARGNWQVGVGAAPEGIVQGGDAQTAISQGATVLQGFSLGGVAYIANNLPYIRRLENGHSQQAPAGMVRVTMASIDAIVGGK